MSKANVAKAPATTAAGEALRAAMIALEEAVAELIAEARAEAAGPSRLFSVSEAAERLGIGKSALYGLMASGQLRSLNVGDRRLISDAAIRDFILDRE